MIIQQRDALWWFKLNGALRHAMVRGLMRPLASPIVLTEYPKSGGTWLSQMLSATLDIPYPRNRLPSISRNIIHGCFLNVHDKNDTIVVWRDGRDTMVSFYYHLVFEKPITSSSYSQKLIQKLGIKDPYDINANLIKFIEWAFDGGYPGYSWAEFVRVWQKQDSIFTTSYEAVSKNPKEELIRALTYLGMTEIEQAVIDKVVSQFSFENQSNRQVGEEDVTSFVRKGIVGDWKNVFDHKTRQIFDELAGNELIALGYERDNSWVNS